MSAADKTRDNGRDRGYWETKHLEWTAVLLATLRKHFTKAVQGKYR